MIFNKKMKFLKKCRVTKNAFFVSFSYSLNLKKWFLDVPLNFRISKIESEDRLLLALLEETKNHDFEEKIEVPKNV